MKLSKLLEMPEVLPGDLRREFGAPFLSMSSIERRWEIIQKSKMNDNDVWTVLSKLKDSAMIGHIALRDGDQVPGLKIHCHAHFKDINFNGRGLTHKSDNVKQITLVLSDEKSHGVGYAASLYFSLIEAGFVIISDNQQYVSGKQLWKKIVGLSSSRDAEVYIIDNGEPKCDSSGYPIVYDGMNIHDEEIWGSNCKFVLLLLRKKL